MSLKGGTLSGTGAIFANVTNAAVVSPGGVGAGTITVEGSYTQTATGALNVDLGGLTAGSQYDQLNVSGTATLDGTLNIDESNGFAPANGDSFTVLNTGARAGKFATINGLQVGTQISLLANYANTNVTLVSERPGIRVTPTTGLQTSQSGTSATFTVVLDSQPTANVSIGLSSSDLREGTVSTSQLVFTPLNWNVAQTVTVTGVDDLMTMATRSTPSSRPRRFRAIPFTTASTRAMSASPI